MFFHDVICPVSYKKIDSNVSRLTVFMNAALLALYLLTGSPYFVALVAIDYGIRAIGELKYSPIRFLAVKTTNLLDIPVKRVDRAPKLFASRVGLLFAFTSTLLFPLSVTASLSVAGVLLVFAVLDSVFDFCLGCLVYSYVVLPFYRYMGIREVA